MNKRIRQYAGLISALLSYYLVHEGAHFLYAIATGTFKQINLMALGVQVDIYRDRLSDAQLGWFCLAGPMATFLAWWLMVAFRRQICSARSQLLRACAWYVSIIMAILDPIYLSVIYRFVGGGDMNGISMLVPEIVAQVVFAVMAIINVIVLFKIVLPVYSESFKTNDKS